MMTDEDRQEEQPGAGETSEAELAELREMHRREAEANRPRYEAQDAELTALTKEGYRALLEAVLAGHIADAAQAADPAEPEEARLFQWEINGLCVALRLLGGYEGVAFNPGWAHTIRPATFDWRAFLGYHRAATHLKQEGR